MFHGGRLTIIQMNDSHGYLEPHQEICWSDERARFAFLGGYARIATLMNEARAKGDALAFDCGDTLHGTYLPTKTRGRAMLPLLNALDFGAMTAHWDFAFGPARLQELARGLSYPILAINCYEQGTGELAFPPFALLERGGLLVGVIGIASNIVDKVMPSSFSQGLRFTSGREELPRYIDRLRQERVDVIIVVSHLGFPQDMALAGEAKGADIWLCGHTHNRIRSPINVNGSVMIQSGCHGSFLGRIELEVECGRARVTGHRLLQVDGSVIPDPDIEEAVQGQMQPHRDFLQQEVERPGRPSFAAWFWSRPWTTSCCRA